MAELEDAGGFPHYHGHRDRLRARFRDKGAAALADYELLEMALFRALPRRDTKPIAKALLKRFGSLAEVLAAPPPRLKEVDGVGDAVISELSSSRPSRSGSPARRCGSGLSSPRGQRFWTTAARPWPTRSASSSAFSSSTRRTSSLPTRCSSTCDTRGS